MEVKSIKIKAIKTDLKLSDIEKHKDEVELMILLSKKIEGKKPTVNSISGTIKTVSCFGLVVVEDCSGCVYVAELIDFGDLEWN